MPQKNAQRASEIQQRLMEIVKAANPEEVLEYETLKKEWYSIIHGYLYNVEKAISYSKLLGQPFYIMLVESKYGGDYWCNFPASRLQDNIRFRNGKFSYLKKIN